MTMKLFSQRIKERVSIDRKGEGERKEDDASHVENRSSGHVSHRPTSLVVFHRRIHRVHEVPDDRDSPLATWEGSLLSSPAHLKGKRKSREEGGSARARPRSFHFRAVNRLF